MIARARAGTSAPICCNRSNCLRSAGSANAGAIALPSSSMQEANNARQSIAHQTVFAHVGPFGAL